MELCWFLPQIPAYSHVLGSHWGNEALGWIFVLRGM